LVAIRLQLHCIIQIENRIDLPIDREIKHAWLGRRAQKIDKALSKKWSLMVKRKLPATLFTAAKREIPFCFCHCELKTKDNVDAGGAIPLTALFSRSLS